MNLTIFFTNIGPNLAKKIENVEKSFDKFLKQTKFSIGGEELSFEEFKKAFRSIQRNKAAGLDDLKKL